METNCTLIRFSHQHRQGVDTVIAEGTFKPSGIHFGQGKLETAAWINAEDGRLYHVIKRIRRPVANEDIALEKLMTAAPEFTPRWV
jgi:hypothetical protein